MSGLVASDGCPLLAGVGEALRVAGVPGEPGLGEDAVAVLAPLAEEGVPCKRKERCPVNPWTLYAPKDYSMLHDGGG